MFVRCVFCAFDVFIYFFFPLLCYSQSVKILTLVQCLRRCFHLTFAMKWIWNECQVIEWYLNWFHHDILSCVQNVLLTNFTCLLKSFSELIWWKFHQHGTKQILFHHAIFDFVRFYIVFFLLLVSQFLFEQTCKYQNAETNGRHRATRKSDQWPDHRYIHIIFRF